MTKPQRQDERDDNNQEEEEEHPLKFSSTCNGEEEPPKKEQTPWPIQKSCSFKSKDIRHRLYNLYQTLSFSYMNPILSKGQQQFTATGQHLVLEDLYRVPDELRADQLVSALHKNSSHHSRLGTALLRLAAPSFGPAGAWEFVYLVCRVTLPVSLHYLLQIMEQQHAANDDDTETDTSSLRDGIPYALSLSMAALVGAVAQNQNVFLSAQSGIAIRSALTLAIYQHALHLTPQGRQGLTVGEVTNLVAVDTQKLYDILLEGHLVWSCPVLACVVTILLWRLVGPELTIGVAVLFLFLPIVQRIVQRMLRIRRERSQLTDQRINILASMLEGIRVTKLNHYEEKVEQSVQAVRKQEMKLLRRELRSECVLVVCLVLLLLF